MKKEINNMTMVAIIAEKLGQPKKIHSGILPVSWSYRPTDDVQRTGWHKALTNTYMLLEDFGTVPLTPYQLQSLYDGWDLYIKRLYRHDEKYLVPFYLTCLDVVNILNQIFKDEHAMDMKFMNEKMEELNKKIHKEK